MVSDSCTKQPDGRLVTPLDLGKWIKPWGKIAAIAFISGERYYFMRGKRGEIAMMPWSVVEIAPHSATDGGSK